jgi:hypothetical protein
MGPTWTSFEVSWRLKKRKKKGRLVGDGLPRLLTATEFVSRVVQFEVDRVAKEDGLTKRRSMRDERAVALAEWKRLDEERKDMQ